MRRLPVLISVVALAVVALAGGLVGGRPSVAQGQAATPSAAGHPLVGSWQVAVAFDGQPPLQVTNLISYTSDGIVLVANGGQLPSAPGGASAGLLITEAHGSWVATGARTAAATVVFLTLDQSGGVLSTNTVRTTLDVDATGDAATGTLLLDSVSPSGNPMGPQVRATFRATRIKAGGATTPAA